MLESDHGLLTLIVLSKIVGDDILFDYFSEKIAFHVSCNQMIHMKCFIFWGKRNQNVQASCAVGCD